VIEDHIKLLDALRRGFEEEEHDVLVASNAAEGFRLAIHEAPNLIVLDLQLPDEDGFRLLSRIRKARFEAPILIATARDAVEDRIKGLDSGADDYIVKPFHFGEVSARVRALLRRNRRPIDHTLTFDDLVMDLVERKVTRRGVDLQLTPRQFEVLAYFLRHKNQLVTREMLARDIWMSETATWTNVIEVQINHLRKKIERPCEEVILHTVRGEGYQFGKPPC
jgi:DNA-binding response OmpR family regulator